MAGPHSVPDASRTDLFWRTVVFFRWSPAPAMPQTIFVAFSSVDPLIADTIASACEAAKTEEQEFAPWNRNDTSGQPIDRSVQSWVGGANALVADISEPNHNVTFEIGFALGLGNPVRLIRVASKDRKQLEEIGLWTGCIGVRNPPRTLYISDCGFKRPYFRALIRNDHDKCIVFHPTLAAIFGTPGSAPARTSVSRRRGEARMDDRQGDLLLGNNRT